MKSSHMLLCAVLLVVGVVPLVSGVGAAAFLPFLGACTLMMGVMMGSSCARAGDDRDPSQHPSATRRAETFPS